MNTKELAISKVGSGAELARRLGVSRQAVDQWPDKVPANKAWAVHQITGIPLEVLLAPPNHTKDEAGVS